MNPSELERQLRQARVPERSEEYWENFPEKVLAELRAEARSSEPEPLPRARRFIHLAWGLGAAFACLLISFAADYWYDRRSSDDSALLQSRKLVSEMLTLFPNQLRAIIQDEHGVRLDLAEKPEVPASTPLWIQITEGGRKRVIVTFSGQNLQLANQQVEVLANAQGQVMLVGDGLFWSSTEPDRASSQLRIKAKPLNFVL